MCVYLFYTHRCVDPMLVWWLTNVSDVGPTSNQHRLSISCKLYQLNIVDKGYSQNEEFLHRVVSRQVLFTCRPISLQLDEQQGPSLGLQTNSKNLITTQLASKHRDIETMLVYDGSMIRFAMVISKHHITRDTYRAYVYSKESWYTNERSQVLFCQREKNPSIYSCR